MDKIIIIQSWRDISNLFCRWNLYDPIGNVKVEKIGPLTRLNMTLDLLPTEESQDKVKINDDDIPF